MDPDDRSWWPVDHTDGAAVVRADDPLADAATAVTALDSLDLDAIDGPDHAPVYPGPADGLADDALSDDTGDVDNATVGDGQDGS